MIRRIAKLFTREYWLDTAARRRDWVGLFFLLLLLVAFPIRTTTTRMACLILAALVWVLGVFVFRSVKPMAAVFLAAVAFILFVRFAPGRPYDAAALRAAYLASLRSLTGTKYVWGGENALGIDCSGLVREGMIEATLRSGLLTMNPALLRQSYTIWRYDCSAAQLGDGYDGRTIPLQETPSLAELDYAAVDPGDIAVTDGGAHTLAYLGNRTWIEADPGDYAGKVIQITLPSSRNPWLFVPMRILRWRLLD